MGGILVTLITSALLRAAFDCVSCSVVLTQRQLKNLEARIKARKEAFDEEVALLTSKIQEEWENGRKNVEESIKVSKKVNYHT